MPNTSNVAVFSPPDAPAAAVNFPTLETKLAAQVKRLDAVFEQMIERGYACKALEGTCIAVRVALMAQNQCRTTYQVLAARYLPPQVAAPEPEMLLGPLE